MKNSNLTAVILVYNEELHLDRCLSSLQGNVKEVFIVDSFSSDESVEIANTYPNVTVYKNNWENSYSKQLNWGLDNLPIITDWVLRIDADEYIDSSFADFIREDLASLNASISGIYINRRIKFMSKEIKHGGKRKEWQLRLFKYGKGFCERRWMDEHIKIIEGDCIKSNVSLIDDNLNNFSWWIQKHNNYAVREALDKLNDKYGFNKDLQVEGYLFGSQEVRKRFVKKYYNKLPLFFGPFLYFLFRYVFLLGFLDGRKGFIFHFMQGLWYRFLVQIKSFEIERKGEYDKDKILKIFKNEYNITTEI